MALQFNDDNMLFWEGHFQGFFKTSASRAGVYLHRSHGAWLMSYKIPFEITGIFFLNSQKILVFFIFHLKYVLI